MPTGRKIKIFVGSDPYMKKAEIALEFSIKMHASQPYEIVWMDHARGGVWAGWEIGREFGTLNSHAGWVSDYECFRFAIPEMNHFEGRAIYLNVEMLFLSDIAELFNYPMTHPVYLPPRGMDVMLIDCSAFKELPWWPTIDEMKKNGKRFWDYEKLMEEHHMVARKLPTKWECMDGMGFDWDYTCAIHFANLKTQPWKPYADLVEYTEHPRSEIAELWWKSYKDALSKSLV